MNLGISTTQLLLSVLFSSIGVGYFIYGRRQKKSIPFFVGIGLSVYTFFIVNTIAIIAIGIILMIIPIFIKD
jgi:hypothetical protein